MQTIAYRQARESPPPPTWGRVGAGEASEGSFQMCGGFPLPNPPPSRERGLYRAWQRPHATAFIELGRIVADPPREDQVWPKRDLSNKAGSAAALHPLIGRHPVAVGHAFAPAAAIAHRGLPEVDALEVLDAVGLAARLGKERIGAGRRDRRNAAEPSCRARLGIVRERLVEPHIGAIRMRRLGMHHGGIGPAGGAFLRHRGADLDLAAGAQRVDLVWPRG